MKSQMILALVMMGFAAPALSKSLGCSIALHYADNETQSMKITNHYVGLKAKQTYFDGVSSDCDKIEDLGHDISLCFAFTDYREVSFVRLHANPKGLEMREYPIEAVSSAWVLTPKDANSDLLMLDKRDEILTVFRDKFDGSGIEVPFTQNHAMLDAAVKAGFEKKLIQDKDPIYFEIDSCVLTNE